MAKQGYRPDAIGDFHRVMVPYLAQYLRIHTEDFIVDIGAGQGHALIPLYAAGYRRLAAVDIDSFNFELFRGQYNIDCHLCNASTDKLPFATESISLVINFHLIEHLSAPQRLLDEAFRILKPGGMLVIVTPDWRKQYKTFYRDPTHIRPYDKESVGRLLRMHGFNSPELRSWGTTLGLGRLKAYRVFPVTAFLGRDILAIARKP